MKMKEPSTEQLSLEREMVDLGEKRFYDSIFEAKQEGRESVTPASVSLLKGAIEPLARAIEEQYKADLRGPGIHRQVFNRLQGIIKPEILAYLTLRAVLDCVSTGTTITSMSSKVGSFIEDELQLSSYIKQNRNLMDKVSRSLKRRTSNVRHQRAVMIHSANKAGLEWEQMESEYKLALGLKLINLLINSTNLFYVENRSKSFTKHKTLKFVVPTEKTVQWLTGKNEHLSILRPFRLPCCDIPKPWVGIGEGGYYSLKNDLIRFPNPVAKRDAISMFTDSRIRFDQVFDVVNAIQETPWKINKHVLEVIKHFWYTVESDVIECLPEKNDRPIPPYPGDDADKADIVKWKHLSSRIYGDNVRKRSKKISFAKTLWVAETFSKYEKIYFPHNLDFRGRVYPIPDFLTPQGDDCNRGLLLFANGKPIKTEEGINRFLRYGATLFGVDKESDDKKMSWINRNFTYITMVAREPLNNTWWQKADKPWQFLAWCFEVNKWYNDKEALIHLPVMVDGTCNGLQHLSALMKDEVGAEAVNLCNTGEKPNDIYEMVSEEARKILPNAPVKIDRRLCKRPVMTTPYGSTVFGMRQQIHDELKKRADRISTDTGEWDDWHLIQEVSEAVYQGISKVIVKSREFMDWLQDIAHIMAEHNWPIEWLSPFGFYVLQNYYETKSRRLKTVLHGQLKNYRPKIVQSIPGTQNVQKNKNAISPNFIHSLDAAHLMFVVNDMRYEYNVKDLHVVHDCFGTHADDVPLLVTTLKETFIEMYTGTSIVDRFIEDFLKKYLDKADYFRVVENRPQVGTFDINRVRESDFFFS